MCCCCCSQSFPSPYSDGCRFQYIYNINTNFEWVKKLGAHERLWSHVCSDSWLHSIYIYIEGSGQFAYVYNIIAAVNWMHVIQTYATATISIAHRHLCSPYGVRTAYVALKVADRHSMPIIECAEQMHTTYNICHYFPMQWMSFHCTFTLYVHLYIVHIDSSTKRCVRRTKQHDKRHRHLVDCGLAGHRASSSHRSCTLISRNA